MAAHISPIRLSATPTSMTSIPNSPSLKDSLRINRQIEFNVIPTPMNFVDCSSIFHR